MIQHIALLAATVTLAVRMYRNRLWLSFPVFWVSILLSCAAQSLWFPHSETWWMTFWMYSQPLLILSRYAAVGEWAWYALSPMRMRESRAVKIMAGLWGMATVSGVFGWSPANSFQAAGLVRQYLYLWLTVALLSVRAYLIYRPLQISEHVNRHGWILLGYLFCVTIGSTGVEGGLLWGLVNRTSNAWTTVDWITTWGAVVCVGWWISMKPAVRPFWAKESLTPENWNQVRTANRF